MLLICNDITTKNQQILEALENKDAQCFKDIASKAKYEGFNYLEIFAGNTGKEADSLNFIIDSIKDIDIKLVIRSSNISALKQVIPSISNPGIIAPTELTIDGTGEIFDLVESLDDDWGILFTQTFGDDSIHSEIENMKVYVSKAEQEGILPNLLYVEPLSKSIASENNFYIKMKRLLDSFRNSYPDMNFYINLPQVTKGLDDQVTLVNTFVGIADLIGVNAFSFNSNHEAHIKAIKAADAILNNKVDDYLKEYSN